MLGLVLSCASLQLPTAKEPPSTRRALLSSTAAVAALALPGAAFAGLKPCPKGAQNCFSTAGPDKAKVSEWVWPSGMSRADATASLKSVLAAYPQGGQDGVDGGGYTDTSNGQATAFEFKSAGTGNFAKFFNGGKPFIDDLEVSVEDTFVRSMLESPVGMVAWAGSPQLRIPQLRSPQLRSPQLCRTVARPSLTARRARARRSVCARRRALATPTSV